MINKDEIKKEKIAKHRRINKEEKRLRESYIKLTDETMKVVDGLIRRAAFMKIALEDFENDLDENGYVELFTQSEKTEPYERERPVARLYNLMNKNYQNIIKQLSSLIPEPPKKKGGGEDDFDEFINDK